MWIRHSTSATAWSAWTRIATTDDIPTLSTLGGAPANVALEATSNIDTTTTTPAIASATVASVMQTIWAKIRSVVNALALKANLASPTFTGTVKVPGKTSAATNDGTLVATEAQVYLKASDADVVKLTGNQTIAGTKTFSISPIVPSKTTAAGTSGTAIATEAQVNLKANLASPTFTGTVSVPSKTTAATNSGTLVATEAQVKAVADNVLTVARYDITSGDFWTTLKAYITTNSNVSQVFGKLGTSVTGLPLTSRPAFYTFQKTDTYTYGFGYTSQYVFTLSVLNESAPRMWVGTLITMNGESITWNELARLTGATFTGTVKVPSKTTATTNDGTLVATEAQVKAVADKIWVGTQAQYATATVANDTIIMIRDA